MMILTWRILFLNLRFTIYDFTIIKQNFLVNIVNTVFASDFLVICCLLRNSPRAITLCINNNLLGASPLLAREGTEGWVWAEMCGNRLSNSKHAPLNAYFQGIVRFYRVFYRTRLTIRKQITIHFSKKFFWYKISVVSG